MRTRLRLSIFLLSFSYLPGTSAAADLLVGPAGSGAAFTEISAAIAAANPGDTIRVAPGTYDAFIVNLPVRVLGAGSDLVFIQPSAPSLATAVRNLAAGGDVLLSGMTFLEVNGGTQPFLRVADCAGDVVLHDLVGRGGLLPQAFVAQLLVLKNSASVVIETCAFFGEGALSGLGGIPIVVDGSQAWVANSSLVAGDTGTAFQFEALNGAPGINVINSSQLFVAGSSIQGGRAGAVMLSATSIFPGIGGSAIFNLSGVTRVAGGPGNSLRGGDFDPADGPMSQGGYAIGGPPFTSVNYAADVNLIGGLNPNGTQAPATSFAPSAQLAFARPVLRTSVPRVSPGGGFDLQVSGNPLSPVLTGFSVATDPGLPLPGFDGSLVLASASFFLGAAPVLNGAGSAVVHLAVPANPSLSGRLIVWQAAEFGTLASALSNPALVLIN